MQDVEEAEEEGAELDGAQDGEGEGEGDVDSGEFTMRRRLPLHPRLVRVVGEVAEPADDERLGDREVGTGGGEAGGEVEDDDEEETTIRRRRFFPLAMTVFVPFYI